MRMSMRRFTRLTNAFSKKVENNCHALALYLVFYNFCRVQKTLGVTLGVNPATAAGVANSVMKMSDADALIDAEAAKVPAARGPYKQREAEISTKTLPELHNESTGFSTGLSQNH
jgi:hypothetical protein